MTSQEIAKNYREFFLESDAGRHFMEAIEECIQSNHTSAETDPEHARDYAQRAKGNRELKELIQSATTEVKRGVSKKR